MALFGFSKSNNSAGNNGRRIPVRSIVRYTHMPEILPRIRAIGDKLGHFAFMLALVFRSARLLPANHPMLNANNIGRYGITDVMATAANGLVMKRENMDQILIFGAVVAAFVMIAIQAVLICFHAFFGAASAADGSMFSTPTPEKDLAFTFLRNVFGVKDIFGPVGVEQLGFHAVMGFYSQAMMIIAVIIVIYYVITVVGEAAQTGTPFGRRFNGLWAPVRLILALGLLVPLGSNLNAAQYLTLTVAKLGSGLATQAWITYTKTFQNAEMQANVATPPIFDVGLSVFVNEACRAAYNTKLNPKAAEKVKILVQRGDRATRNAVLTKTATFSAADFDNLPLSAQSIKYVWTTQDAGQGVVTEPTCGSISLQVARPGKYNDVGADAINAIAQTIQIRYIEILGKLVEDMSKADGPSIKYVNGTIPTNSADWATASNGSKVTEIAQKAGEAINNAQQEINKVLGKEVYRNSDYKTAMTEKMKADAKEKGWMSAGIYYSEMARTTQMMYDAVGKYPSPEATASGGRAIESNFAENAWSATKEFFGGSPTATKQIITMLENAPAMAGKIKGFVTVEPLTVKGKEPENPGESLGTQTGFFASPILWLGKLLFGDALVLMVDTPTLNPMGTLLQAGNTILSRSSYMMIGVVIAQGGAIAAGIKGFILGAPGGPVGAITSAVIWTLVGQAFAALGGILWFFMLAGMAAGIILFYVLPMMPLMYFFFSAVNWVVEVAEAFVSMPLFALAHLRIDGDGLPGQVAYNGWLTLFGVMLRPILIIIGFIVGSLIFNAGAYYLSQIYKYAVFAYRTDAAGIASGTVDFEKIGFFGIFIYVIMFVYMIYLLANASFKLIDQIPDKAMRWIGGQQPFTGDRPVDIGSMQQMAIAGYLGLQKGQEALQGLGRVGKGLDPRQQRALRGMMPKGSATMSTGGGGAGGGGAGGGGGAP